jgi:hypothetical protein
MFKKSSRKRVCSGALMIVAATLVFFLLLNLRNHWKEKIAVENYVLENNLNLDGVQSKEHAVRVSDSIRQAFNTDKDSWTFFDRSSEPFLRHSVLTLLEYREGKCGKGTRVLVKVLQQLGYDATRVSLYSRTLSASTGHTLVSVVIDGKEYLIDSINSSGDFNSFLRYNNVSCKDFGISQYSKRFVKDSNGLKVHLATQSFSIYSYEAVPVSKILSALGMGFRVFNLKRPSTTVSYFAESVYLLHSVGLVFLLSLVLLMFVILEQHNYYN